MKLYVGGAYQGQNELAQKENPGAKIYFDFHETIKQAVQSGKDPKELAFELVKNEPNAVITSNEVGAGIVPVLPDDRLFRESVGRALCVIAQNATAVTRVVCGIGVRIK